MSTIDPLSSTKTAGTLPLPQHNSGLLTGKWAAGLRKLTLRTVLLKIHLYIALWLGALLALAGMTGSLLVYKDAIDKWLNADIMQVEAKGEYQPFMSMIEAANQVSPIKDPPHHIYLPKGEDDVLLVRYQVKHPDHKGHNHHFHEVMVNPYNGEVLGHRDRNDALMTIILQLHYKLLADETGKLVMGITALLTLFLTVTGVYLWWPKLARIRQAFTIKRNTSSYRFNFDLHKTTGIYTAIVMFAVALSGVYFNLPEVFKPAINTFSPLTEIPRDLKSQVTDNAVPLAPEQVLKNVTARFPEGITPHHLLFPTGADGVYMAMARQPTEFTTKGKTFVWVDQYSGEIIQVRDPHKLAAGDTFINLQLPLHNGEILGQFGQIIVLIVGFAPLVMLITGVTVWLRKRRAKKIECIRLTLSHLN